MTHSSSRLAAFLGLCVMLPAPAAGGSAYGGYDISVLELINDGPSDWPLFAHSAFMIPDRQIAWWRRE
jgi:hypothetical protein